MGLGGVACAILPCAKQLTHLMHACTVLCQIQRAERMARQSLLTMWISSERGRELDLSPKRSWLEMITFSWMKLSFRGRRDDRRHIQQPGNHGNFHALLNFWWQNHLDKAPLNAMYTQLSVQIFVWIVSIPCYVLQTVVFCRSKTDTTTCCSDHIHEKILTEVQFLLIK